MTIELASVNAGLAETVISPANGDHTKIRLPGTHRAAPPSATLEKIAAVAPKIGITRIADITRLDSIGIPTYQAIRPDSWSLTVSQGKGATNELAKISAAMESIELWHAERNLLVPTIGTVREMRDTLTYDVDSLAMFDDSVLHDDLPLQWVEATSLTDGASTHVPYCLVEMDLRVSDTWRAPTFLASSNGLASGNTMLEATLHALYEVVERDAVARVMRGEGRHLSVDPGTLESEVVCDLTARMDGAGAHLVVQWLESPTGLPCFAALLSSDDYPLVAGGYGCHIAADIAMSRAVTEAAQSRLSVIAGARDDIGSADYRSIRTLGRASIRADPVRAPVPDEVASSAARQSLAADLLAVGRSVTDAFGAAPLLVDLTQPAIDQPVVRVIVPGCRIDEEAM